MSAAYDDHHARRGLLSRYNTLVIDLLEHLDCAESSHRIAAGVAQLGENVNVLTGYAGAKHLLLRLEIRDDVGTFEGETHCSNGEICFHGSLIPRQAVPYDCIDGDLEPPCDPLAFGFGASGQRWWVGSMANDWTGVGCENV